MNHRLLGVAFVLCSTLLEAIGQLSLKSSATASDGSRRKFTWFAAGVGCLALEAVVWSCVLRLLEVSIAFPMSSLTFVVVTLLSALYLRERVNRQRWLGVGLILGGTAMVGLG
jgi:undecaprenyl phosphate-alpha-L-ara4N flippase subunit ArnE